MVQGKILSRLGVLVFLIGFSWCTPRAFAADPIVSPTAAPEIDQAVRNGPLTLRNPTPIVSPDAWLEAKELFGSGRSVDLKLKLNIKSGTIEQASVENPGQAPLIEREAIAWVKQRWQFRPEVTMFVTVPIEFIVPAVIALDENHLPSGTEAPPVPYPREFAAVGGAPNSSPVTLRFTVDHGKVVSVQTASPAGNPLLARSAESWLRDHWVFRPTASGEFTYSFKFIKP
jgi:hypothetical protein